MGGAAPISTKGGKKAVDAAINLVPFIDLLSCCISFLLITAVWSQLGRIETRPPAGGTGEVATPRAPSLTVYVDGDGHTVVRSTGERQSVARVGAGYDYTALAAALGKLRGEMPDATEVVVHCQDGVEYGDLIRTMDAAMAARFTALRVDGQEGPI